MMPLMLYNNAAAPAGALLSYTVKKKKNNKKMQGFSGILWSFPMKVQLLKIIHIRVSLQVFGRTTAYVN